MGPFPRLAPLVERSSDDLGAMFGKMAEKLARSSEKGHLQCCIYDDGKKTCYSLKLGEGGSKLETKEIAKPHFEILTERETMLQIAQGTLSPLTAFYHGQMRIRGDIELGKRLLAHLGRA